MADQSPLMSADRLRLPQVTLCAVTSVNVAATVRALEACLGQIAFADCLLLTDAAVQPSHPEISVVPIERLGSSAAYSDFILSRLVDHITTPYCLVAQWDGHVLDAGRWHVEFLDYDYIGASWPQFDDGHDVGNGGFSLRSRRLMEACRTLELAPLHPEDLAIGRTNRDRLERQGMRFAPRFTADLFSAERAGDPTSCFGYHGVFNMPQALGVQAFRQVYDELDDFSTVHHDLVGIIRDVRHQAGGYRLSSRILMDQVRRAIAAYVRRARMQKNFFAGRRCRAD